MKSGFISLNSSLLNINDAYILLIWFIFLLFLLFFSEELLFEWDISDLFKYLVIGIKIPQNNSPKNIEKILTNGSSGKLVNKPVNLINRINEIIKNYSVILYLYPYLYFFSKGIINNIKIIYSLWHKILSFDKQLVEKLLKNIN